MINRTKDKRIVFTGTHATSTELRASTALRCDLSKIQRWEVPPGNLELQLAQVSDFTGTHYVVRLNMEGRSLPFVLSSWEIPRLFLDDSLEDGSDSPNEKLLDNNASMRTAHEATVEKLYALAYTFYEKTLAEMNKGNYELHLYDDGRLELKLL